MTRVRGWAAGVSFGEWLALSVALAVFAYVGWDGALWDARLQLLLHLFAIGAIGGVAVLAVRGHPMPRTALELPLLGLLAALAMATMGALNVGMSLRAMGSIVAFAAMLPVALIAVRLRPSWVGLLTSVPILLLSIPTLAVLVARRVEWLVVGAPGIPPLRLPAEGTPFGSVAVPPFILVPAWILAGLIEHDGLRRGIRGGLVAVGLPLILLSGSRSAWLAITVGIVVGVAPWAWRRRRRLGQVRLSPGRLTAAAAMSALLLAVGAFLVVPRLTAVTSLVYRGALWRDTLVAWGSDPVFGIGPGFMPYARQAAAPDLTFPVRQPHSHNVFLGVLGDAGLVGLLAAAAVVVVLAVRAGPWRSRTVLGRTSAVALVGLAFGSLFEDLTFLPNFNLLVILLAAVALQDSGSVRWVPLSMPKASLARHAIAAGSAVGAFVLMGSMVAADAGAIAYRLGVDRAGSGEWHQATEWLSRSVALDPWHPAGARSLAVTAAAAGRSDLAVDAARSATVLSPGDATAWTNLAILCESAREAGCAGEAADEAVAHARYLAFDLINAALVLERLDDRPAADQAYRLSLLTHPATSFVDPWPRPIVIGAGTIPEVTGASWELNLLLARQHTGEAIVPAHYQDPALRALANAIVGDRPEAERWLAAALAAAPGDVRTHDINVVLHAAWGEATAEPLRWAAAVRGNPLSPPDAEAGGPPAISFDIASFRAYPLDGLVPQAVRLQPSPPLPWALLELIRGPAPETGVAE